VPLLGLLLLSPHQEVRCRSLQDLMDYSNPLADAALLKCAILYCGYVDTYIVTHCPDHKHEVTI
jgi:hypothetical protein